MKKTILLAATLATLGFGAAMAETAPSTQTTSPAVAVPGTGTATIAATPMTAPRAGDRLASKIVGAKVYATSGEKIGDVDDLLVDASGKLTGVIVGVGGILGVGEKSVALPYASVSMGTEADGKPRLTVDVSKETLEKAPAFAPSKS